MESMTFDTDVRIFFETSRYMFSWPVFNVQMSALKLEVLPKMAHFTPESQSYTHEASDDSKKVSFPSTPVCLHSKHLIQYYVLLSSYKDMYA
jgi:hypothetical protein